MVLSFRVAILLYFILFFCILDFIILYCRFVYSILYCFVFSYVKDSLTLFVATEEKSICNFNSSIYFSTTCNIGLPISR